MKQQTSPQPRIFKNLDLCCVVVMMNNFYLKLILSQQAGIKRVNITGGPFLVLSIQPELGFSGSLETINVPYRSVAFVTAPSSPLLPALFLRSD